MNHVHHLTMQFDGLTRSYTLKEPSITTSRPPLLVVLHGGGNNGRDFREKWTGQNLSNQMPLNNPSLHSPEPDDMVVVYPSATTTQANPTGGSWNVYDAGARAEVDDVGFIEALIHQLAITYRVDMNQIFIAGNSNGGNMVYRVVAEKSHLFAAFAIFQGSAGGRRDFKDPLKVNRPPATARPLPMFVYHNKQDGTINYQGNISLSQPPVYQTTIDNDIPPAGFALPSNAIAPDDNARLGMWESVGFWQNQNNTGNRQSGSLTSPYDTLDIFWEDNQSNGSAILALLADSSTATSTPSVLDTLNGQVLDHHDFPEHLVPFALMFFRNIAQLNTFLPQRPFVRP